MVKEGDEPEHLQVGAVGPINELDAVPHWHTDRVAADELDAVHRVDVPLDGRAFAETRGLGQCCSHVRHLGMSEKYTPLVKSRLVRNRSQIGLVESRSQPVYWGKKLGKNVTKWKA